MAAILAFMPGVAVPEIIWSGDFRDGNFVQYHRPTDTQSVAFQFIPPYGRPVQYGSQGSGHVGDGSLLSLVSRDGRNLNGIHYPRGPTRGSSPFAAKFTIKNSASGVEPDDCDLRDRCDRRRTTLSMQASHPDVYNALPHMGEFWLSASMYIPDTWWDKGSGFGPNVMGIKMRKDEYARQGYFRIALDGGKWRVGHFWNGDPNVSASDHPWQYQMYYTDNYPSRSSWPEGLRDFPDEDASRAALLSVNKGGWTDWVVHMKQDHRGSDQRGTGFLTVWKREDSGPWIRVLHILPKRTTRGGITFDHGIGYNLSRFTGSDAGGGTYVGLYMSKDQIWDGPNNQVIYIANHKIGGPNAKFSDMSPDGSSPGSQGIESPPKPPRIGEVD